MRTSIFVIALATVFAVTASPSALGLTAAPGVQNGLAGNWTVTFDTPDGIIDASANFLVDGEKVTGSIASEAGEAQLEGSVKDNAFTLNFDVQTGQGPMSIAMAGTFETDSMKGTFNFGQGESGFSGKRKN